MKKKFIHNADSENRRMKVFSKGKTILCKIAKGMDIGAIPINRVGLADRVDGNDTLIGYQREDPFSAMLELGGD